MTAAEHFLFIAWSYAGVAVVTLGLIGYVVWDAIRVKRKLAHLEKSGIRRRSAGTTAS
jgi:heme exporter protein CcmD